MGRATPIAQPCRAQGALMPISEPHRRVASVALRAAAPYGFALGGGNALIIHGIVDRLTQDVDLFTDNEHAVALAAEIVEEALLGAGLQPEREDKTGGLADLFEGMADQLAEWTLTLPDGVQTTLQMAYIDRHYPPVMMDLGPVLNVQDVVASKVCALASRVATRDYIDTAASIDRYGVTELIALARRLDPGLTSRDFADAGRRLDDMPDEAFERYQLGADDVAELRRRFEEWPRG
jgi:hypothetical protein